MKPIKIHLILTSITFSFLTINALGQDNGTIQKQSKITFQNVVFGRDVCGIGDLNEDGINDVAVGAPEDFNNQVYILFLDSSGAVKDHTIIASNQSGFDVNIGAEDDFGNSIANVGDLNNDGNTDIAVGAPSADYGGYKKGGVWILFLNRDGTVKQYQQISDISGNLGARLNQEDEFGKSLGSLQQNNSSLVKHLLIGTPERNNGEGSFFILSLNDSGKVMSTKEISSNTSNFNISSYALGSSVQGIDDLNNDGTNDIIVGDVLMKVNNMFKGGIWVLFMSENLSVKSFQKISEDSGNFRDSLTDNSRFGNSVTLLNDINGDDIDDVAVGGFAQAYQNDSTADRLTGKVWILFLDSNGMVKRNQAIGNELGGFQDTLKTGDRFGRGVANIGDLNNDSVPELAVGATGKKSVYTLFLHGVPQMPNDDDNDTTSGLQPHKPFQRLNTYPNPVAQSQNVTLSLPANLPEGQRTQITLFDMEGQLVYEQSFRYQGQPEKSLAIPEIAPGSYQLFLKAGEFQGFSKILVK